MIEPARTILLMVHELHKLGYQKLRIYPGLSPSGMHWRCTIAPASGFSRQNGALLSGWQSQAAHYSSSQGAGFFGWQDVSGDNPETLAGKFIERFPELIQSGLGTDPAYVDWYLDMLQLTGPDALPVAYADWELPADCLTAIRGMGDLRIPLPPPGQAGA